ncbi:MAG: response regulator [Candidatus Heimdallarchaeaceae archaeon]
MNILFIDDEEGIIFLITHMFAQLHPEIGIYTAMDGKEGLEKLDSLIKEGIKIDLVALDIKMPGISGLEVGKRILDNHENIPVVFFTAYDSKEIIKQAESIGIDNILSKSIGIQKMLNRIADYAYSLKK